MAENEKAMDYGAFLADLEAKRAALDAAISSVKTAMWALGTAEAVASYANTATTVNLAIHNSDIPAGAFLRKSIPEAAKLYLAAVKKKQTTKEIAKALLEGGMETNAKDFETTVKTGLHRVSKNTGEFVRLKGGTWGLAEWYPAAMRTSPKQEKPKGRKAKKSKSKDSKATADKPNAASESQGPHLSDRILELLRVHPKEEFTKDHVSQTLGVSGQVISPALARLVRKGSVRMPSSHTYTCSDPHNVNV